VIQSHVRHDAIKCVRSLYNTTTPTATRCNTQPQGTHTRMQMPPLDGAANITNSETHYNTLQNTATHSNRAQTHECKKLRSATLKLGFILDTNALGFAYRGTKHCSVLQHTLQHTAIHCSTLQHTPTLHCTTLQHATTHCNTL